MTNVCGNRLVQNDFKNTVFEMKVSPWIVLRTNSPAWTASLEESRVPRQGMRRNFTLLNHLREKLILAWETRQNLKKFKLLLSGAIIVLYREPLFTEKHCV